MLRTGGDHVENHMLMKRMVRAALACLAVGYAALSASNAAAAFRYVSATGNDAGSCTAIASPCLTLQKAIDSAPRGADIRILSDTLAGGATILKSVTITGNGASLDGNLIIMGANSEVTIRGLKLNGTSAGGVSGILIRNAKSVSIDDCEISNFNRSGISC